MLSRKSEIAAIQIGGSPSDFEIANEKVFEARHFNFLGYAEIAAAAIELGGKFSGQIAPEDINDMTRRSVSALAGTGLIGVARDNLEKCDGPSTGRGIYTNRVGLGNRKV